MCMLWCIEVRKTLIEVNLVNVFLTWNTSSIASFYPTVHSYGCAIAQYMKGMLITTCWYISFAHSTLWRITTSANSKINKISQLVPSCKWMYAGKTNSWTELFFARFWSRPSMEIKRMFPYFLLFGKLEWQDEFCCIWRQVAHLLPFYLILCKVELLASKKTWMTRCFLLEL